MSIELFTEDRLAYQFYPVTANQITFKIKARNDAHIILTTTPYESQPCYEIFLGGWENSKSVIRKNKIQPDVCEVQTPQILNPIDYKAFWIRWDYGTITAGLQGDMTPILKYSDPQIFPIQYFGVCTGWGSSGHWIIDTAPQPTSGLYPGMPAPGFVPPAAMGYAPQPSFNPYHSVTNSPRWLPNSGGSVPPNAVVAGNDLGGEPIYVARAHHEGALIPGKLVPSHGVAYVAWGGRENPKEHYEILCDCSPRWFPAHGNQIPPGAFISGQTENGETLYVGRAYHDGSLTPGKVQPTHGVCYIPFGGNEVAKTDYEILVL